LEIPGATCGTTSITTTEEYRPVDLSGTNREQQNNSLDDMLKYYGHCVYSINSGREQTDMIMRSK
jgi:hypothetical protein